MDYQKILFNIKLLHENREILYKNRLNIKYDVVSNHSLDIFDVRFENAIRYDIDYFFDGFRCETPIVIKIRKDPIELEFVRHFKTVFIYIDEDYITNLSFDDINKIDNLEYTLIYGRIELTNYQKNALSSLPNLIIKYIEKYK